MLARPLRERRSLHDPRVELPHVKTKERRGAMAYVKDQWTRVVKQADGTTARVRTAKWGRGKRWLAAWIDPEGRERSKAFGTKGGGGAAWGCDGDGSGAWGVHRSGCWEGSV